MKSNKDPHSACPDTFEICTYPDCVEMKKRGLLVYKSLDSDDPSS